MRRLLGTQIPNAVGYAIVILIGLHALDLITTYSIHQSGIGYEANPVAKVIYFDWGIWAALLIGLIAPVALVVMSVLAARTPVGSRSMAGVCVAAACAFVAVKAYYVVRNLQVMGVTAPAAHVLSTVAGVAFVALVAFYAVRIVYRLYQAVKLRLH